MREVNIKNYSLEFGNLTTRLSTKKIVIHHTGNSGVDDDLSAKTIHKSHQNIGWSGIGYHYVVRKDGSIEEEGLGERIKELVLHTHQLAEAIQGKK